MTFEGVISIKEEYFGFCMEEKIRGVFEWGTCRGSSALLDDDFDQFNKIE